MPWAHNPLTLRCLLPMAPQLLHCSLQSSTCSPLAPPCRGVRYGLLVGDGDSVTVVNAVFVYDRCGVISDVMNTFDEMPKRDAATVEGTGKTPRISEPSLLLHNMEPSIPVQPHTEGTVVSKNKDIARSSYFIKKRICTNQEDQLAGEEDYDTFTLLSIPSFGTCNLPGDQLRKSGILKRRKFSGIKNFEYDSLQPISSDDSPPVIDEGS